MAAGTNNGLFIIFQFFIALILCRLYIITNSHLINSSDRLFYKLKILYLIMKNIKT